MFKQARIKLTAWYLLIIMGISITFSLVIARAVSLEVERFERIQRLRIETRLQNRVVVPPDDGTGHPPPFRILMENPDLLEETKRRVYLMLFAINLGILVTSGLFGYVLAGRTLAPIKNAMDDQNRFVSDASHELRTPLAAMKTSMEVALRDRSLDLSGAKTIITESIEDVNKLQSLSDNLLQIAQYQTLNGSAHESVLLSEAVQKAVRKMEPLAKKKKILIQTKLSPVHVKGSAYGLIDLVVILIDNAIKYSPQRTAVTVKLDKKDKSTAELIVKDEGIGIAEKDLPHIFDRFFRADTARSKSSGGGYGLGLSIAKQIVNLHKGRISVVSTSGKGTTFHILLPVVHEK